MPAPNGTFQMDAPGAARPGQTREPTFGHRALRRRAARWSATRSRSRWPIRTPSARRAIANVTGLLARDRRCSPSGLAVVVSAALTRRFTTPLRQLTEASRALAEGDLSRRVPAAQLRAGSSELGELAVQFNAMADRLEESVEIIRRDRDRSRDFLADVSHELRTPLAALRTFNQLLMETAGDDPSARAEFLESSAGQIERLDWLAQNLLELSKLDSGLVLLDLRPDDLRAAVESAAHQHDAAAAPPRRPSLIVDLPDAPDPHPPRSAAHRPGRREPRRQRDQVHAARRSVRVAVAPTDDGARIDVTDTGVGIDPSRAAPHLRALLSRLARQRGARQRQRPRPGHRPLDRRHARRDGRRSRAAPGAAAGSPSTCRAIRESSQARRRRQRADVASAAEGSERIAAAAAADGAAEPAPRGRLRRTVRRT